MHSAADALTLLRIAQRRHRDLDAILADKARLGRGYPTPGPAAQALSQQDAVRRAQGLSTTVRLSATALKSLQRAGVPAAPIPDLPDAPETAALIPAARWRHSERKASSKASVPARWDTEGDA